MTFSFGPKKTGIALALEEQEKARRDAAALMLKSRNEDEPPAVKERKEKGFVEPEQAKDRIGIIFDDSSSMDGEAIKDAQEGTIEFLKNCQVNLVAAGIFPMNAEEIPLDTNLPKIAALIPLLHAVGGTPMYGTWIKAQAVKEPAFTRLIIFSDGQPTDKGSIYNLKASSHEKCINQAIETKVPVDTVYIASDDDDESAILKEIAERTGGIYLRFQRGKVNFRTAFKYLTPGMRLMLNDPQRRKDIEEGRMP